MRLQSLWAPHRRGREMAWPSAPHVAFLILLPIFAVAGFPAPGIAQQTGDPSFNPVIAEPAFPPGGGPTIGVDEAHSNFHTADGRFGAFAQLARADGFVVEGVASTFDPASLSELDILVIANALHPRNEEDWSLPTPSAFSPDEIAAVRDWVESGGSLLLIADHMPFPGAAGDMAAAFGFQLNNGFALDPEEQGPLVLRRSDGSLAPHPITDGGAEEERVDSVATFTGEAFRSPPEATDLLILPEGFITLMPDVAWQFSEDTPRQDVAGWSQGSVRTFGEGRVAVFGEAAMFTAQLAGPNQVPVGMNAPVASQNARFVTNLLRWLTDGK